MTIQPSSTSNAYATATQRPSSQSAQATIQKTLSPDQQKQVDQLKKRDADVHQHEQAHLSAAGGFAKSGAVYDYQNGPDGKQYAVGGHVDIDVSPVPNDPKATIQKEQTVQRAALAPVDPSGEDRAVAAQAAQSEAQAQVQLSQNKSGDTRGKLLDVTA